MNLHTIVVQSRKWIWISIMGRRQRHLGDHLYELAPELPPEFEEAGLTPWGSRATPERYRWSPYLNTTTALYENGFIRPLCGYLTTSTRPLAYVAYNNARPCARCRLIAGERGILAEHSQSIRNTPEWRALREEHDEWQRGRQP